MVKYTKQLNMVSLLLLTFCLWGVTSASNILVFSPFFIKSHYNFARNIIRELIQRGHNLTVVSPYKEEDLINRYRLVQMDEIAPVDSFAGQIKPNMFEIMRMKPFMQHVVTHYDRMRKYTEEIMESKSLKHFVDYDDSKFDLIIIEDFRFPPFFLMAHKYNVPIVTYSAFGSTQWIQHAMGNPMNLHYVPEEILPIAGDLTLYERLTNVVCSLWELLVKEFFFKPKTNKFSESFYSRLPQPLPKATEMEKNVSLVLLNTHFSMDVVRSYLPNIIEVAGLHIKPAKELTKDLKEILDNAKSGVVYFSMGSVLKGTDWPKDKLEIWMNVLGNLKQTILWKWENDTMPNRPKNVIIRKWFPQNDLLAHPNIRLFITHGGLLSIHEANFYGIPLIGIPIFADQPSNIKKAKVRGYAECLDYDSIKLENTREMIHNLLNDPKYREKAKEISVLTKDRPMSPLNTAIYWIEYVIRHKGAYHLKTPSAKMNWIEYNLIDVIAIIALGFISVLVLFCIILKYLWGLVFKLIDNIDTLLLEKKKN